MGPTSLIRATGQWRVLKEGPIYEREGPIYEWPGGSHGRLRQIRATTFRCASASASIYRAVVPKLL